jgi:predicted ribosomally synthesized peptide with SipW-like signal peptide
MMVGIALGIGGTIAFFSDTETSASNTFTAGTIDISIGAEGTYNGQPLPLNSWARTDLSSETLFYELDDVKPGDSGSHAVTLQVDDNSAWACLTAAVTRNDDMTCVDPELSDDPTCTEPGLFMGELGQEIEFFWWVDDGNGTFETGEAILGQSTFATTTNLTLADSTGGILGTNPLVPSTEYSLGTAWCHGTLTTTNGVSCDGSGLSNASQSDELEVALSFFSIQSRNNEEFECGNVSAAPVNPPPSQSDIELKISLSSDNPDPAILEVSRDDRSDEYVIFIFDLEADGGDVTLNELVIELDTPGATTTIMIDDAWIEIEGNEYDFEAVDCLPAGCERAQYMFDIDGDVTIPDGATTEVWFSVEFEDQDRGGYEDGQTVQAQVSTIESALWVAKSGDTLPPSSIVGAATGETHTLSSIIIFIDDVDADVIIDDPSDSGTIAFEFILEVEGSENLTGFNSADILTSVTGPDPSIVSGGVLTLLSGDATETTPGFFDIDEGDDATFRVEFTAATEDAADNGVYQVALDSILGFAVDETSPSLALTH